MFCEDTLLRVEKDDTVESLYEKFIKNSAGDVEIEPETANGDVPNPKWKKLREEAAVTIGAAKLANSNAQTTEEIAAIAKSSVDFATILVRQLEFTE